MKDVVALKALFEKIDGATQRTLFLLVFVPQFAIFLATATWTLPYHIDAFTNVLAGWQLGSSGTFYLTEHEGLTEPEYFRNLALVVPAKDSAVSQYPPGAALLVAPLYAVWPQKATPIKLQGFNNPDVPAKEFLVPPLAPAAIISALTASLAMSFLVLIFSRLASNREALGAAYILAFGTSIWTVAADQLWQHSADIMWIALGMLLATSKEFGSGLAFGAAILTRPPTALIAACTGLAASFQKRNVTSALLIGIGSAIGLALVFLYNKEIFGELSFKGGYSSSFQKRVASHNYFEFGYNIFMALFSPKMGLLIYSPFLLPLFIALPTAWKKAPNVVRGSAIGGVLYLLVHLKANRYSGGAGFSYYRYPLEFLISCGPLLLLSYTSWVKEKGVRVVRIFLAFSLLSVAFHLAKAW